MKRLICDPGMKKIWTELLKRSQHGYLYQHANTESDYFHIINEYIPNVFMIYMQAPMSVKRAELCDLYKKYLSMAERLQEDAAEAVSAFGIYSREPEAEKALSVSEIFSQASVAYRLLAKSVDHALTDQLVIERERADRRHQALARELAALNEGFFGNRLLGTIATILNVLFPAGPIYSASKVRAMIL